MFEGIPKKLIIVGNKDTDVYCEYLSMLISTIDDIKDSDNDEETIVGIKDGSIDSAIWTNEIYRDNRAHTSSRQKFLFIGNEGCAENIIKNVNFHDKDLQEHGIYYGWLGNKAVVYVDDTLSKDEGKFKTFEPLARKEFERYNEKVIEIQNKNSTAKKIAIAAGMATFFPVFLITLGTQLKESHDYKVEVKDCAYKYVVLKFYLDYLKDFMG